MCRACPFACRTLASIFSAELQSVSTASASPEFSDNMAQNSSEEKKGFFDSLVDNVKNAGGAVVDGVGKVGNMAVSGVKSAGSAVGDVAGKAVDAGKVG